MGFNSGFKGLNAASRAYPLLRDTRTDTQMGKIILQWKKKTTLLPKGSWLTAFTIAAMCSVWPLLIHEAWHFKLVS